MYERIESSASPEIYRETRCPKEVVIEAANEDIARKGNDTLWASFCLVHAGQFHLDFFDIDHSLIDERTIEVDQMPLGRHTVQTSGVVQACRIAAKASFRVAHVYALEKYHFSASLCSVALVDLDPHFATETLPKLKRPLHQVQAAQALSSAYGVLEELRLEVRANAQQPSCLSNGAWNPVVKQDLEMRLRKAGIDLNERFNWQIRGPKTRLESGKPRQIHHNAQRSPWAKWSIRDRMVDVVDAIAHLSWLRSHVCSHRLKPENVRSLTAYDVTNGQFLARRLILETLGLWKRFRNEDE